MTVAGTIGGAAGGTAGEWLGGIGLGVIGGVFGPGGAVVGGLIGRRIGRVAGSYAGRATGEWLATHMSNADKKADKDKAAASDSKVACAKCAKPQTKRTCSDERHAELEAEKDELYRSLHQFPPRPLIKGTRERADPSCASVRMRLEGFRKIRDKRMQIQEECYKDNPESGHETNIEDIDKGIKNLEKMEERACNPQNDPPVS